MRLRTPLYRDNQPRASPLFAIWNPSNPDSSENTPRKRTIWESERTTSSARTRFARPISRRRLKRRPYPIWRIRSDMSSGFASPTDGRDSPTDDFHSASTRANNARLSRRSAPSIGREETRPRAFRNGRNWIGGLSSTPSFPRRAGERGLAVRSWTLCSTGARRRADALFLSSRFSDRRAAASHRPSRESRRLSRFGACAERRPASPNLAILYLHAK